MADLLPIGKVLYKFFWELGTSTSGAAKIVL